MKSVHGRTPPLHAVDFQLSLFPWRGQDSITINRNPGTQWAGTPESLQGYRVSVGWMSAEHREEAESVCCSGAQGTYKDQIQESGWMRSAHYTQAGPQRTGARACKRQARDELFPRNASMLSHVNSSQTLSESQDVFIQIPHICVLSE